MHIFLVSMFHISLLLIGLVAAHGAAAGASTGYVPPQTQIGIGMVIDRAAQQYIITYFEKLVFCRRSKLCAHNRLG